MVSNRSDPKRLSLKVVEVNSGSDAGHHPFFQIYCPPALCPGGWARGTASVDPFQAPRCVWPTGSSGRRQEAGGERDRGTDSSAPPAVGPPALNPSDNTSLHQLQQSFSAIFFFSIIILLRRLFKHFYPNPFLSSPIIETVIPQIHCRSVSMCCVCVCAS